MKLGAEPRKMALLAVLLIGAAYAIYTNIINPDDGIPDNARGSVAASKAPPSPMAEITQPRVVPPAAAPATPTPARRAPATRRGTRTAQEFEPRIGARRPEDRPDPTTLDPSLRLDLLAKLKRVTLSGGDRSLFDFAQPPAPPVVAPKIHPTMPIKPVETASTEAAKPVDPPPAPKPPIPLKFYGFIAGGGPARRGFFLNGEEIFVVAEGEMVQKRYRIVRIGLNSAVVEDIEHKNEQTLPLEQVPA